MPGNPDVIVIGGGISGLAFAFKAAESGRKVLIWESQERLGGCIYSEKRGDFWFEMGAHTTYNSYGGLIDIAQGVGAAQGIVQRGMARATFGLLRNGKLKWLTPPKVLFQLNWLEAGLRFPFNVFRSKTGHSVASYYSQLIGPNNFSKVLSPFFSAVPSQLADKFPVEGPGSLFKKRDRRETIPRSFGLDGGLQTICDKVETLPGVTVETGTTVASISQTDGQIAIRSADGREVAAPILGMALPPKIAASLLGDSHPDLAGVIADVQTVDVESMGVILPKGACAWPDCAFVVPVDDVFYSVVTRDPFPDPRWRSFVFHFKAGQSREDKLKRISEVLGVDQAALGDPMEHRLTLPAPRVGHERIVADIDAQLSSQKLAVCGNYFGGLAIEDCVQRSFAEWERVRKI